VSEYAHVERPLLIQLARLGWTAVDQGASAIPKDPVTCH
jgi:type I restriction enzyme R subunit